MTIYFNRIKEKSVDMGQLTHIMSGHIHMEKYKGQEIKGTATPDKWQVISIVFDSVINEFPTYDQAMDYKAEHSELNLGLKFIKGKPNKIIEVAGSRQVVADWFDNLITTNGREQRGDLGTSDSLQNYCQIGTGTATETAGDTALGTYDRYNDSKPDITSGGQATAPYYGWIRVVYRFDPPGTNDNYAELGFSNATVGDLFSRARIKNGGTPTTIAVDADEWLDVTYELRQYPDHLTTTSDTVNGYDVDILACQVSSVFTGIVQPHRGSEFPTGAYSEVESYGPLATLGVVTGKPGGDTNKYEGSNTFSSYVASSYERDVNFHMAIGESNFTGGIGCINFGGTPFPNYQVKFDPPIPKTSSDVLDIGWTYAWAIKTGL